MDDSRAASRARAEYNADLSAKLKWVDGNHKIDDPYCSAASTAIYNWIPALNENLYVYTFLYRVSAVNKAVSALHSTSMKLNVRRPPFDEVCDVEVEQSIRRLNYHIMTIE